MWYVSDLVDGGPVGTSIILMGVNAKAVIDTLRARRKELSAFGVSRLAVFGSLIHSSSGPHRDIDLLVRFEPGSKTFDNFMGLKLYLEDLFPEERIDLVLEDALKPAIRERVLAEACDVA